MMMRYNSVPKKTGDNDKLTNICGGKKTEMCHYFINLVGIVITTVNCSYKLPTDFIFKFMFSVRYFILNKK